MSDFTFIDLFAGIGGTRIAFSQNGGKCVFSSEIDRFARQTYAANFGETMVGLSGNYEQISTAAENFKVSFAVTKTQTNYTVQHTANVYVINPEGELIEILSFATPAEDLLAAMN